MFGLGTLINSASVILAGLVGLVFGKLLKERIQKIILLAIGLSVFTMSLSGIVSKMLVINNEALSTKGTYTIIFSLVLGGIIGEIANLDKLTEDFGIWLKKKTNSTKDAMFVDGFVTASLTTSIGAMAIIGALNDGISHDPTVLITKSILDFIIVVVMTCSMGKGCMFCAIPIFILQGSVTLLSRYISPIMNVAAMNNLSMVGSVLIMCIGINIIADGKFKIKVANLLPAVVLSIIAAYLPFL